LLSPPGFASDPQSILFDYGGKGKLLSLQNNYGQAMVDVAVDTLEGTKLRHKIEVGTDFAT